MKRGTVLLILAASASFGADRYYSVRDLGAFDPGLRSYAEAIDDTGLVLGYAEELVGQGRRYWPAYWSVEGGLKRLPFSPFGQSLEAIDCGGGYIVGVASNGVNTVGPYRWSPNFGFEWLALIPGANAAWPRAVSSSGRVVGNGGFVGNPSTSVYWDDPAAPVKFLDLPTENTAEDANLDGLIVGTAIIQDKYRGYKWEQSSGLTLLSIPPGLEMSYASKVTPDGRIIGGAFVPNGRIESVIWGNDGQYHVFPDLPDGSRAGASASNESGILVGTAVLNSQNRAICWPSLLETPFTLAHRIDPITSDTWDELNSAVGINSSGWITGTGYRYLNGVRTQRWYIAFPLPLHADISPATWRLFRGQLVSGGELSFLLNKDGQYMVTKPGPVLNQSEAPVQLIVDGNCPSGQVTELRCKARLGVNSPSLRVETLLFDWTGGNYVRVDERAATQSDMDLDIPVANPGNFIRSSDRLVKMKLSIHAAGPVPNPVWQARFDFTGWTAVSP